MSRSTRRTLERLGRAADAELKAFFGRTPQLVGWRERVASLRSARAAPSTTRADAAASGTSM
jgi:hypothetical protein